MHINKDYTFIAEELQEYKDQLRKSMLHYTRRAFYSLPRIPSPSILDIGCGSGVPTIELARLSNGDITAIDTDQVQLDRLSRNVKKAGLLGKITIFNCSMLEMNFPTASFDIVWAEGSISVIGFEKGISEWRYLLKPDGFLVVHDDLENFSTKCQKISYYNYNLIDHFILDKDIWWNDYYAPLEKKVKEIRRTYHRTQKFHALLEDDQKQIDGFHKYPDRYQSVFFIMKRREN
jgi:ubiquinone/menaquinone biosynthesis C-methylase UbiE